MNRKRNGKSKEDVDDCRASTSSSNFPVPTMRLKLNPHENLNPTVLVCHICLQEFYGHVYLELHLQHWHKDESIEIERQPKKLKPCPESNDALTNTKDSETEKEENTRQSHHAEDLPHTIVQVQSQQDDRKRTQDLSNPATSRTNTPSSSQQSLAHQCIYCSKKFVTAEDLEIHTIIHGRQKNSRSSTSSISLSSLSSLSPPPSHSSSSTEESSLLKKNISIPVVKTKVTSTTTKSSPLTPSQLAYCRKKRKANDIEYENSSSKDSKRITENTVVHEGNDGDDDDEDLSSTGSGITFLYKCFLCTKFSAKFDSVLTKHLMVQHANGKSFPCKYCDVIYDNVGQLFSHIKTHPQEHPHCCSYCDTTFRTKEEKLKHEKDGHMN